MLKQNKLLILSALCATLATTQTPCAQEATPSLIYLQDPDGQEPSAQAEGAPKQKFFDVIRFVEQIEAGELTDEEIRPHLHRRNPPISREERRERGRQKEPIHYCSETPAMQAIWTNQMNALETLMRLGVNLEQADDIGRTPLELAAGHGNVVALNMLIEGKANVDTQGHERFTPVAWAAHSKKAEAVKILLGASANPNIQNRFRQTPLIAAIRESDPNPEIVRDLLDARADVNIVDNFHKTATVYAQNNYSKYPDEMEDIMQQLVAAGAQPTKQSLTKASEAGAPSRILVAAFSHLLPNRDVELADAQPEKTREKKEDESAKNENDGKPKSAGAGAKEKESPSCRFM
jgi:hypothetical protein